MVCKESSYRYKEVESGVIKCLDLDEETSLPQEHSIGVTSYRDIKQK